MDVEAPHAKIGQLTLENDFLAALCWVGYTLRRRSDRIVCAVREAGGSHHVRLCQPGGCSSGLSSSSVVDAMTKRYRSFLLVSLVPAFLLCSVFAVVQAQNAGSPAARPTNWSDPATWPDRKVPAAGDKVTIERGKEVVLDVSPPALGSLTIDGKLSFANNSRP